MTWCLIKFHAHYCFTSYKVAGLKGRSSGVWKTIFSGESKGQVNIQRFDTVWGGRVRISIDAYTAPPAIAAFGVYNERR